MNPTIQNISSLIDSANLYSGELFFVFRCEATGKKYASFARLRQEKPRVEQKIRNNFLGGLFSTFSKHDVAAVKPVSESTAVSLSEISENPAYSSAAVQAFSNLINHFFWNETTDRWEAKDEVSVEKNLEFLARLKSYPVRSPEGRAALKKMVVMIIKADGKIDNQESIYLHNYFGDESESLTELLTSNNMQSEDFATVTSTEEKETIYMICWSVALVDDDLDEKEISQLEKFRKELGISEFRGEMIRKYAVMYYAYKSLSTVRFLITEEQVEEKLLNNLINLGLEKNDLDRINGYIEKV